MDGDTAAPGGVVSTTGCYYSGLDRLACGVGLGTTPRAAKAASKQEDREAVEVDASGQTQWIIDHANKDHEDSRQNNLRFIKRTWSTSH